MTSWFSQKRTRTPKRAPLANVWTDAYLYRLYVEGRKYLFAVLLDEVPPAHSPFPTDVAQVRERLERISALLQNDTSLAGCRERLAKYFSGDLGGIFGLSEHNGDLHLPEPLRQAILRHIHVHPAFDPANPEQEDLKAIEVLKCYPRLQQQLAYLVNYTPNKWLLGREIPIIQSSRELRTPARERSPFAPSQDDPYAWSRDHGRLRGLCFSGGGIRSATFNLGVLQGLARANLLRQFDYLSSVSGGGYIHEWLAAWIKREDVLNQPPAPVAIPGPTPAGTAPAVSESPACPTPGLDAVCRQLIPAPEEGCAPIEPEPIRWLRRYSNYLTPQKGLFTADTWVTVAIWLRNTTLNQIILVAGMFLFMLIPHVLLVHPLYVKQPALVTYTQLAQGWRPSTQYIIYGVWLASLLALAANLISSFGNGLEASRLRTSRWLSEADVLYTIVLPMLTLSLALSIMTFYMRLLPEGSRLEWLLPCLFLFVILTWLNMVITQRGGAVKTWKKQKHDSRMSEKKGVKLAQLGFLASAIIAAAVGSSFLLAMRNTFIEGSPLKLHNHGPVETVTPTQSPAPTSQPAAGCGPSYWSCLGMPANKDSTLTVKATHTSTGSGDVSIHLQTTPEPAATPPPLLLRWSIVLTLGPPLVMLLPFISIVLHAGLIGHDFEDWLREWLARVRAWAMLYSMGWVLWLSLSLFGHMLVNYLAHHSSHWVKWPVLGAWVFTTLGSVLAGKSGKVSGDPDAEHPGTSPSLPIRLLTTLGPPAYVIGLLLIVSWAVQVLLDRVVPNPSHHWLPYVLLALIIFVPLATFVLFGWRVDINEFSMHAYYRNRLARCYLGASNFRRNPDPLTGFDPADVTDLNLCQFQPSKGYTGPFPIFCAALNISIGEDLAWQERKAASFAFTPLFSGYHVPWTGLRHKNELSYNGFVPTATFAYARGGINLSTVTAISGAAISPNMGYHSSPAMAFLLTMFNIRLGWWLPNPRRSPLAFNPDGEDSGSPHPRFAPYLLADELLGRIGDDRKFVYLTDGGHFENLGLYELVRRRCYEIVICDAAEDSGSVFEGIGMAIRKCRIDFGAEITLDLAQLVSDPTTGRSKAHWICGTIRYPETAKHQTGTILYIKSSLTGHEPSDVYNYKLQHKAFPQDTTTDQWFTESQFESYRRLGQSIIERCPYFAGPHRKT